jgi:DNA-binding NarL/FixJ family response regulator
MEGNLPNRFSIEMSKQEKNLIVKLTEGLSSKEIAQQMEVTPKTVETYRERLLKKLKVKNVAELISFAFKTGHDKG